MNHTYRLVWNQDTQRYIPAPECAKGQGKSKSTTGKTGKTHKALAPAAIVLSAAFTLPTWAQAPPAHALPSGHDVVSGNASISQSGSQMHIQQGSHKAIIDWASFHIGQDSAVTFAQPDASAIVLNRVTAGAASQIHGQLNANGQVWLVNPNGVVFGAGSQVDVGGLVASSMGITNADFENGHHTFTRNGATGSIINQGTITAKDGGSIALLAPTVRNDGILSAQLGSVAMAAGEQITLQTGDTGLLSVQVAPATLNTLVENRQLIVADGGQVIMTGKAADALAASVVSNSGAIAANSLQEKDGKILLLADMQHGETQVAGTLEAKFIDTSAATVSIDKDLKINTHGGQWLIDPVDITIDSSKASAIETALGTGDVTVSTSNGHTNPGETAANNGTAPGDIHVHADISYTTHQLTLNADRDIHLKAQINVNDSGTLALNYGGTAGNSNATPAVGSTIRTHFGDSGGFKGQVNFASEGEDLLQINGTDYTVIKTADDLQNMQSNPSGHYALGGDVDASGIHNFEPIGNYLSHFTGSFDGLGHTISGLTIDHSDQGYVGLFGAASNAALRNVSLEGVFVQGQHAVGGLAGWLNGGSISQAYVTGTVSGTAASIGGLVGQQGGGSNIGHAYATAEVSGNLRVGGLVGSSQSAGISISHAYASGAVTGTGSTPGNIGGLVGEQSGGGGSISHAYASGAVSGDNHIGGLVGYQSSNNSQISHAYASGAVSGNSDIGGLVGRQYLGSIDHAYYATTDAAGNAINQSSNALGTGKTFAQLADPALYTGWDSNIWSLAQGAQAEGYEIGLPSLIGVTRAEDVTRSTLFADGWGTEAAAYGIANWEQLSNTRLLLDKHYQLNNDLDSSTSGYAQHASTTANSGAGWQPIGNDSTPFTGSLDGQDHTISGLRIFRPNQDSVGLFGETMTASVQRIGLIDAQVTGHDYVGSLVGFNGNSSRISHSYASGGVVQGDGDGVGGLAGANAFDSSISHSYSSSHVQAPDSSESFWVGGLVGSNLDGSTISNSYATGAVTAGSSWFVGGLVGENDGSTIEQSYATGLVEGGAFLGGLVGSSGDSSNYDNSGSNRDRVDNSYYATTDAAGKTIHNNGAKNKGWGGNAYGTGKTFAQLTDPDLYTGWDSSIWSLAQGAQAEGYEIGLPSLIGVTRAEDVTRSTLFANGWGTEAMAYGIANWEQLSNTRLLLDKHYQLNNDLDSSTSGYDQHASATANGGAGWQPIGSLQPVGDYSTLFTGSLDGQNHTISGLTINRNGQDFVGLFGAINSAELRNIALNDVDITGHNYVGGLAGYQGGDSGSSSISHASTSGQVIGNDEVGGLVGWQSSDGNISHASTSARVSGNNHIGGLVGWQGMDGNISHASASGQVSGNREIGGLVGYSVGSITASHATGNVDAQTSSGTWNSYQAGGLVGLLSSPGTISDSYATGDVSAATTLAVNELVKGYAGGLVGESHGSIRTSYATGNATAEVQTTQGTNAATNYAGGLVGYNGNSGNISDSYATGQARNTMQDDKSYDYLGGLVGWNEGQLQQVYATGQAVGGNKSYQYRGGLVGYNGNSGSEIISQAYYATTDAAGNSINNAGIAEGAVSPAVGGWNGNAHGTAKTFAQLADPGLYADWNKGIWQQAQGRGAAVAGYEIGSGLPSLIGVTRPQDIITTPSITLFDGGMGVADNAYGISSWQQLAHIGYNADTLSGGYHFALTENLDSSSTGYATLASETANGGAGWLPLGGTPDGTFTGTFTGTFDGQGHTISNLYIHRPNANNVGLFASTHNATLRDVHLLGGSVTGYDNVGALAGDAYSGYGDSHIHDVSSTANVSGRRYVGALLGAHWASTEGNSLLSDARASGNVQGTLAVGGLAGRNTGNFGTATITRAHATGTVTGGERVGGLVGQNFGGTVAASISEAYATGTVTGDSAVGGLVGINHTNTGTASIANTWVSSTVQGGSFGFAGGLVGHNGSDSSIRNSYARGTVSGDDPDYTGGLVGWQQSSAPDALVHSFHTNTDANDDAIPINGWGRIITRAQLLEADTFADWGNDLAIQGGSQAIWRMYDGFTAPQLKAFMQDLEVTHTGVTGGDLGSVEYSGHRAMANAGGSYNHTGSNVQGSLAYITTSKNAQTHSTADGSLVLGGLYSAQYDIRYTPAAPAATLTITPKPLSVSGITAYNKTYDGTTEATLNTSNLLMDGLLPDDRVILESATGTFDNRHAGTDKPVTLSNPIYGGDDAGNYTITTQDSTTADINPAYLSVSTEDVSKTYDGSTQVIGGKLVILYGRELFGSDSLSGGSFAYTDKNAGLGNKTVTVEGVTVDDGNNGDNYTINQVDNESSTILQAPLTISIKDASKTQGSPLTLNGSTGFTADGLIPGETITQVELTSPGTPTNATPGSYTIAASNPSGTAFDANNYSITYQPGTLTVVAQAGGGETGGGETGAGETGGEETGGGETGGGETGSGETGSGETGGGETSEGETGGGETGGGETGGGETGGEETGGGETGGGETGGGETGGEETGGGETGGGETGGGETGGGETGGGETGSGETGGEETGGGETGGGETGSGETDSGETGGGETGGGETGSGETGSGEAGGGETGGGETSGEETGGGETGSGETGGEETGGGETGGGETGGGETGGGETGGEETGGGETGGGETGGGETGNTLPPSGGAIAQALQQDDEEERQRQARRTPPPSPSGIPYLTLEPGFIPVQGQ